MQITHTPETQLIEVNVDQLMHFLKEEQFDPEITDALHLVLLPVSHQNDVTDEMLDDYEDERWVVFVPCGNKGAAAINQELFALVRQAVLEEAFAPWDNDAAERCWEHWGQPTDIEGDAQAFAARAPLVVTCAQVVSNAQ